MSNYSLTEQTIDNFKVKNASVENIEKIVDNIIASLPIKDKQTLREEMQQMRISVPENPTTFEITEGLAKSQAYRDRLSQIYIDANNDKKMRQRCLEMLCDVNNVVSKASSVDKRKGEATLKYPSYFLSYELSAVFLAEVEMNLKNMENIFNTFSRQASVMQLQVQLGEYKGNKPSGGVQEMTWV